MIGAERDVQAVVVRRRRLLPTGLQHLANLVRAGGEAAQRPVAARIGGGEDFVRIEDAVVVEIDVDGPTRADAILFGILRPSPSRSLKIVPLIFPPVGGGGVTLLCFVPKFLPVSF